MGNVSLINGHIDGSERCVVCGREIPEGRQYCVICGYKADKKQTNYDRIRNMSVEELASKIVEIIDCKMCPVKNTCETWQSCEHEIIKWLGAEVTE